MHELSIALSLVDAACEKAAALGEVRVEAVYVRLGPLSGVVKDALSFCFDAAARGSSIDAAHLEPWARGWVRDQVACVKTVWDVGTHRRPALPATA